MRTLLLTLFFIPASAFADNALGIPDFPTDVSTWTDTDVFYAGLIAGFVLGGTGFVFRLVRQVARQNAEI